MSSGSDPIQEARDLIVGLIDDDAWEITDSAWASGQAILRQLKRDVRRWSLVEYIRDLLEAQFSMHAVPMGEPPGSAGTGYVMNNCDGQGLYIKLVVREERFDQFSVVIVSFHPSKH